jgi:hypothetical protein
MDKWIDSIEAQPEGFVRPVLIRRIVTRTGVARFQYFGQAGRWLPISRDKAAMAWADAAAAERGEPGVVLFAYNERGEEWHVVEGTTSSDDPMGLFVWVDTSCGRFEDENGWAEQARFLGLVDQLPAGEESWLCEDCAEALAR